MPGDRAEAYCCCVDNQPLLYFNPSCSKCRTALGLLKEHGTEPSLVRYLDRPPTTEELQQLMRMLRIADPRAMMRTAEPVYRELGLGEATNAQLLDAIAKHPILLERPIFVWRDKAVIARPPERLLSLMQSS